MTSSQWIGVAAGILLIAFIAFAFRQGMKVKPDGSGSGGTSVSDGGSDHGHGGAGHF